MPLGPEYDKMIDSKFADMKNTGGRFGGSITAAQFLQRFVDKTPWAHLDIAGTAHGLAADRHQQELGLGLGRAAARSAGGGALRVRADDRDPVLPPAAPAARERVLPQLLEKSLERGWRVVVQAASEERVDALDAHLWTYRDDNFLPHGTDRESEAAEQPVLLTTADDNPNGATVRFLIDGVPMPPDAASYQRIVLLFDGEDEDAVAAARDALERGQGAGFEVDLLAAGRAGPLGQEGLTLAAWTLDHCGRHDGDAKLGFVSAARADGDSGMWPCGFAANTFAAVGGAGAWRLRHAGCEAHSGLPSVGPCSARCR